MSIVPFEIDRRKLILGAGALTLAPAALSATIANRRFPKGFLWGAASAGHQVEGNNVASDVWLLENIKPTIFAERSGDANNSFALWQEDLDLAKSLGLNCYRFSLEWARIEPEAGLVSIVMLDHYKRVIEGCRERGLTPVVTFNHFTTPRWFAARGGWTNTESAPLFAKFCALAARHLAAEIGYAVTLNEPQLFLYLDKVLPPQFLGAQRAMLDAAARATGSSKFSTATQINREDHDNATTNLIAAHKMGRAAIKAEHSTLPVGVALAMTDDQAVGADSIRDAMRQRFYGPWLEAVRNDDFLGVQNYGRERWDSTGHLPPPPDATLNFRGTEVYPMSLAGAVEFAHTATGLPILVTEHGVGTDDDTVRAALIPAALQGLKAVIDRKVPVIGYIHWSLIDNFEWSSGYKPKFGLVAVDRTSFRRSPKPSAAVYRTIASRNSL